MLSRQRSHLHLLGLTAGALLLAGCADDSAPSSAPTTTAAATGGVVEVAAGFYPLAYVAEAVGGDRVSVTNLTRPGAEPHDLELAPRDVAMLTEADLVVHLAGMQPAVDDAVAAEDVVAFDVTEAADLSLTYRPGAHEDEHPEDDGHADEDEHADDKDGEEGEETVDPHFWLDPLRLAAVGEAVAERLAEVDPAGAQEYAAGAEDLTAELTALDAELAAGLSDCRVPVLVTSHNAFGYLADRYGFEQVGISGLSPEDEPDPRTVAEVAELVQERGVTTVYSETLVDPAVAQTVADEAGAQVAVLDPLEGLTDASAGDDYPSVMRANLEVLRAGQECA